MPRRRVALAAALALALTGITGAAPLKPSAPPETDRETEAFLRQMGDAQKWMGEEIWKIKEKVDELPTIIAASKDDQAATEEELDKLRDEVKGLYVESSTVKQAIDALKGDVGGVNSNVSSFRTFSGLFIALMILLLAVIFAMTIRR